MFKNILLVADGSASAQKAVLLAVRLAVIHGARMTALYVIDAGWRNILGDEWISSEESRRRFFRYMEGDKAARGRQVLEDIAERGAASGLQVKTLTKTGSPDRVVAELWKEQGPFDLVVVPHPSGRNVEGAAGIKAEKIARELSATVLIGTA